MRHSSIRRASLPLLLLGLMSCGGEDPIPPEDPPVATEISLSQTEISMTFLGQVFALTATVLDQFGRAFNASVTFSIDDATVATVSEGGVITAVSNGTTTVRATSGTLSASATVTVAQVAERVFAVSGNTQTGTVGEALAEPVVVRSEDRGGNPVPGTSVTFTLEDATGSVSTAQATTDAEATASTVWTLGTAAGEQRLTAAIEGSDVGRAFIDATALPGPAAALVKASGDEQLGTVGVPLSQPVAVTLTDQYGNGVAGGSVTFEVTGGGGTVDPAQQTTGEDGMSEATWTMGAVVGPNTLSASAEGIPLVSFSATARPAMPDLRAGDIVIDPANPTALDALTVSTTVSNIGHLTTGAGFQVQLLLDGAEVGTASLPEIAPQGEAAAVFSLGPLTAGARTLRVVVDSDGTVEESDETNNTSERVTTVPQAVALVAGTPVSGLTAADSVEHLFVLEVPAPTTGTVIIETSGGTGDLDLYVHYGDRPAHRDDYQCQSGTPDTSERCVFNAAEPGTYYILAFAWDEFSGVSIVARTGQAVVPYNLELQFINRGTSSQDQAFEDAAARWNAIIRDDVPGFDFSTNVLSADACIEGQPLLNTEVDDVLIYVDLQNIDGPGGTLASAGPCVIDPLSQLPVVGIMKFDTSDLDNLETHGALTSVVLHEMGHVLGVGTIWNSPTSTRFRRLHNPSLPSNSGADTYFDGPLARIAFQEAGGASTYTLGEIVPVENDADEGSADAHWRESVLDRELMTPDIVPGELNPLSAITIQSLADVGYRVDVSQADPYSEVYRAPTGAAATAGPIINLRGDLRRGPIYVMGKDGRLREVVRR